MSDTNAPDEPEDSEPTYTDPSSRVDDELRYRHHEPNRVHYVRRRFHVNRILARAACAFAELLVRVEAPR